MHHQRYNYSWFQTFTVFWMLYGFFWVIPRRLNLICQRFGTLCPIFIGGLWRWNRRSVPKRRHIKFRRRGITQKKAYIVTISHIPRFTNDRRTSNTGWFIQTFRCSVTLSKFQLFNDAVLGLCSIKCDRVVSNNEGYDAKLSCFMVGLLSWISCGQSREKPQPR